MNRGVSLRVELGVEYLGFRLEEVQLVGSQGQQRQLKLVVRP